VSEKSQRAAIARHLKSGKSLTALEALNKFGCLRLAARCYDLKQQGMSIHTYTARVGSGEKAKRISVYYALRGRAA
jgi:hypothetical protein